MKLLAEFCIISNHSKRSVFWTPCSKNLVMILLYGIAFSSVFKLWKYSCCRFMLCLTLWRWKFRWYNRSFCWSHTDKCRTVLSIGEAKNLKYKEVVLPENVNNKKTGYHAECFRKFTALGRNAPRKNDDVESKPLHTRSKSTLASGSSSTGIMPKICIFCTKKDKKHNGSKQKLVSVEIGRFWRKDQEKCNNPRGSSIIIQIGKRWFCCQRNTERNIR